ncbi:MAG: PQQ-binding-like beta-propeller repeat protein [Blastocatellia bacterium]
MRLFVMTMRRAFIVYLLALSVFDPCAARASGEGSNWPQWRGPAGQGVSEEKGLPTEWSDTKNVEWKTPIPGRGHSSPIVWGNRIFLTTAVEGPTVPDHKPYKHMIRDREFTHPDWTGSDHSYTFKLICVHADTGKIVWERTAYDGPVFDHRHRRNTYASPTPTTDGKYVYAFFGSEGLYCYDFNGKAVWKASLGGIPQLGMGPGSSPVIYGNLLIVTADQDGGESSYITALDKATGRQVWKTPRNNHASWATPVLVKTDRRVELVVSGSETAVSYDPATGKELWRCKGVESHAIPTPVVSGDIAVLSAGSQAKRAMAIRLGGTGDITDSANILWKYQKGTAYVPSPILYGDYVYLMTDAGILTCIDVKTGEVKYEGGRVPVPAKFMASPVAFDGKILLTSEDGDTFVLKAGPTFEVVRTNSLAEPVFASPAIARGKIFIRGERNLYCIGARETKAKSRS